MSELGRALKGYRHQAGLSLRALAERTRLSHSYIAKLETDPGAASPSVLTLVHLARALSAPLGALLNAAVTDAGGQLQQTGALVRERTPEYAPFPVSVPPQLPPDQRAAYAEDVRVLRDLLAAKYGSTGPDPNPFA